MKTKLVWRLSKLPTPEELQNLVAAKIITQEEAKSILLKEDDEETRDKESLESEVKFLRELVDKLSNSRAQISTVIKEIEVPYYKRTWYPYYQAWCGVDVNKDNLLLNQLDRNLLDQAQSVNNFSGIQTF